MYSASARTKFGGLEPVLLKRCNLPLASPISMSISWSPSKSPNVGDRFNAGILRFILRLMLEMFCQSLSIKSNEGVSILPIFLNNANDEDGFPPL